MPRRLAGHVTQPPKLLPPLSAAIRSRAWTAGRVGGAILIFCFGYGP